MRHYLTANFSEEEYQKIKEIANKNEWSMSKVIHKLVMLAIEKNLIK